MKMTERVVGQTVIISLSGKLVFDVRKDFQDALAKAREKNPRKIVLNIEELAYLDSAGLGLLALGFEQAKVKNIEFCILKPSGTVMRILEMTQLPKIIPVFDSEEHALRSAKPVLA
ncbi:STAS domain-containing protein [Candidatus Nitronereus thalassa]|uniref:Anti-sigma factor antagonist n=1 Tax=Candidatus Nitronereus thalassa TaxID=3020898 RepID=A0ABU3K6S2_9BACT|nr:STAS domain-containing protein [Candidatus Nitronereus thalassa]MDT7042090.1 STAS domain-containing protein [Candidatus Nitronereus thalassa]